MNNLVSKIISEKINLYFISPHLDDAMLSCGDLLSRLSGLVDITVVNVFTEAAFPPYTLSTKNFLKQCNSKDAFELFKKRREEDKKIWNEMGIKVINLGFIDAQWRKKDKLNFLQSALTKFIPEFSHIYPTYRWHIIKGEISKSDNFLMDNIKKEILGIVNTKEKYLIFCPMAVGNHVDHVVVRNCCLEVFGKNLILWSDFPYNDKGGSDFFGREDYQKTSFSFDKNRKWKLIKLYESQFDALIKDGMRNLIDEKYYLKK